MARLAKVAPSTVSLVTSGKGRVSEKTRKRVEEAIKQVGYRPSPRRQTRHIAVVYTSNLFVHGKLTEYCREWIRGIRSGIDKEGSHVSLFQGVDHVSHDPMFLQSLEGGDFDGAIVMGSRAEDHYLQRVLESGLPMVAFNRYPKQAEFSAVSVDVYNGGRLAAQRLAGQGHKRVGVMIVTENTHNKNCHQGFVDGLAEFGIAPVSIGGSHQLDAAGIARVMVEQKLTGMFCGDPAAQKVGNELLKLGVRIPQDVSLIGIDDMGFELDNGARLTSLSYDKVLMGELAGQFIQQLISASGRVQNLSATVAAQIAEGQTVGGIEER